MGLPYAAYLLGTVPPKRLLQVAGLRSARLLKRPLPGPLPLSRRAVLHQLGVSEIQGLPEAFSKPLPGAWPLASPRKTAAAVDALGRRFPVAKERILQRAESAVGGRVDVFGVEVSVPRLRGAVPFADPTWARVDWERCPRGLDPKFAWAIGRLEHVVHLALAARLGGEGGGAFARAALDWSVDLATAPRGIQWACPMEVALRGANLAIALRLLAGTGALERRPETLCALLGSLDQHAAFVASNLEETVVVPNNHLVANVVGLLVMAALAPDLIAMRRRGEEVIPRLSRLLLEQTLPDGFTFEGSVGYHRLAVELFVLGGLAANALGASLSPEAARRLEGMFRASAKLEDGRGETPQIGDIDSGQGLPFLPRAARDHSHLASLASGFFGGRTSQESPESLLLFGPMEGAAPSRGRRRGDDALPAAGIYLQRSYRMSCAISCGPNGTGGTGTHGHNDKLSIEVCVDGVRVVADPGTGVYTSDPALRNRMRGTASHSTAMVDGEEQQPLPPGRLFALPELARARCLQFESGRERAHFVGTHEGYLRLPEPVIHQRAITLDKRRERLSVVDSFCGVGRHQIELRYVFPFGRDRLKVRQTTERERAELGQSFRWLVEVMREGAIVAILASGPAPTIEDGLYAEGYGALGDAAVSVIRHEGPLPLTLRSCVSPPI